MFIMWSLSFCKFMVTDCNGVPIEYFDNHEDAEKFLKSLKKC